MQVFDKALVWFSIGGEYYVNQPVNYVYMADTILKEPRNVSIRLNEQIGQFVKLQFYFANVWISISEVVFDSEPGEEGQYKLEQEPFKIPHTIQAQTETETSTDATMSQGECKQTIVSRCVQTKMARNVNKQLTARVHYIHLLI